LRDVEMQARAGGIEELIARTRPIDQL